MTKRSKFKGDKMSVKAKIQKDYLTTEVSIELPTDVSKVHELLTESRTSGKMVVLYNEGHIQGINVEQKTKMSEAESAKVRELLAVSDVEA